MKKQVIILGDSFNNTLGLIRSVGEAGIDIIFILVGKTDRLFVRKSRYLKSNQVFQIENLQESLAILDRIHDSTMQQYIICSNDKAALFIDSLEAKLSKKFLTPMRGHKLGEVFDKDIQCTLANECGFDVPKSFVYHKGEIFQNVKYPILLKPLNSMIGEKSDIHICHNDEELKNSLSNATGCKSFIVQEYIEKEYEINLIGVRTDNETLIAGGIQKIRHYPTIYSPCSFGVFKRIEDFKIEKDPIVKLMNKIGYYGPFSLELLHKGNKNYFMEVNFRHDGLAYTATAADCNLLDFYINDKHQTNKLKTIFMMDVSIDFCHVKDHHISLTQWIKDIVKTDCQLNFNLKDPMPTIFYYVNKLKNKFKL